MANNNHRWMPTAGGVISIICGALGFIGSLACAGFAIAVQIAYRQDPYSFSNEEMGAIPLIVVVFWTIAVVYFILSIIPFIGGIFSLQRKNWGWALAGAICATLCSGVIGIVSLVFIAVSRSEFAGQNSNADNQRIEVSS